VSKLLLEIVSSSVWHCYKNMAPHALRDILHRSLQRIRTETETETETKVMGSRLGVTWRHRSRDHSTRCGRLPMGGPYWPCICLAPLWRYGRLKFFQEGSSRNRGRSLVCHRSSVGRSA